MAWPNDASDASCPYAPPPSTSELPGFAIDVERELRPQGVGLDHAANARRELGGAGQRGVEPAALERNLEDGLLDDPAEIHAVGDHETRHLTSIGVQPHGEAHATIREHAVGGIEVGLPKQLEARA